MSHLAPTNAECCLTPIDSARFIMERARHVSINLSALQKLASTVSSSSSSTFVLF
jgi:isoaspartyl peptidase/L-asparaginase-like protein (Ntn-hydrolase superfamily)